MKLFLIIFASIIAVIIPLPFIALLGVLLFFLLPVLLLISALYLFHLGFVFFAYRSISGLRGHPLA
jgi:hypothetical protein